MHRRLPEGPDRDVRRPERARLPIRRVHRIGGGLHGVHALRHRVPGPGHRGVESQGQADLREHGRAHRADDPLLPGLHARRRPPHRRGGDRGAGAPRADDRRRPGRLLGARVRVLQLRHVRGRARPGAGGRDRRQARAPRPHRLHLPGRRRSRLDRRQRDPARREPRREVHGDLHQQRHLRDDGGPDGAHHPPPAADDDLAVRPRRGGDRVSAPHERAPGLAGDARLHRPGRGPRHQEHDQDEALRETRVRVPTRRHAASASWRSSRRARRIGASRRASPSRGSTAT